MVVEHEGRPRPGENSPDRVCSTWYDDDPRESTSICLCDFANFAFRTGSRRTGWIPEKC